MSFKNVLFLGIAACTLCAGRPANATFVTGNTSVNVNSGPVGPPVHVVLQIDQTGGELYTNQYSGSGVGAQVRTVGAIVINTLETPSGNQSPVGGVGNAVQQLVVAFAIQGTVVSVNPVTGVQVAAFDKGGFGIWETHKTESNVGTFAANNASTWFNFNAGTVAALTSNAAYLGALIPPDNVIPNPAGASVGDQIAFAASQINVSAENLAAPQNEQGQFLFGETFNPGFLTNYGGEIVSVTSQTAQFKNVGGSLVLDNSQLKGGATSQNILNNISQLFLGANFATFGSGTASDWLPNTAANGDFSATLGAFSAPNAAAPEPGSMALLATGSVLAGLYARRRKGKK